MTTELIKYDGIDYSEDIFHIPLLSPLSEALHYIFPSLVIPFHLSLMVYLLCGAMGVFILSTFFKVPKGRVEKESQLDNVGILSEHSQNKVIDEAIDRGIFTAEHFARKDGNVEDSDGNDEKSGLIH